MKGTKTEKFQNKLLFNRRTEKKKFKQRGITVLKKGQRLSA